MVKVFLVDDEIVIREGIRNSFPWEESGYTLVGEAPGRRDRPAHDPRRQPGHPHH